LEIPNLKAIIDYFVTVKEDGCGEIQNADAHMPWELRVVDFQTLALEFSRNAGEFYQNHRYVEALFWYTLEVKVLGVWLQIPESDRPNRAEIEIGLAEVYYNRGNTYDELQEYDKAIKDYHCALALNNLEPWDVLQNRGLVYEKLGQLDEAERDMREAYRLSEGEKEYIERSLNRVRMKRHKKKT